MRFLILVLILAIASLACDSANDKVESVLPSETASPASDAEESPGDDVTREPTRQPTQTAISTPDRTPTPIDNQTVTIERQGFVNDPDGTSGPSYAVVVKNQSTQSSVEYVRLQIAFYDGGGTVLGTQSETVSFLQPGEVTAVGGSGYGVSGVATEMRVQILADDWSDWDNPLTTPTVSNIAISYEQYFGPKVTGEIASPFTKDMESVEVIAVYYDAGGNIVGGDFTFVDFIPAGGTAAFEVTSFNEIPGLDHVEVYPQLSSLTLLGLD